MGIGQRAPAAEKLIGAQAVVAGLSLAPMAIAEAAGAGIDTLGLEVGEPLDLSPFEEHHMLPREFASQFEKAGLDVEEHTTPLSRAQHRLRSNGIHTKAVEIIIKYGESYSEKILTQLARRFLKS